MKHNSGDKAFGALVVFAVVFNLAWVAFIVWAIYTLVTWLVTK